MKKLLSDSIENVEIFRKEFLEDDLSVVELADKHKCSTSVIQRFLKKHNIRKNYIFKPTIEQHNYIVSMLSEGKLHKDIAYQLGIQPYIINRYINSHILHIGKYSNQLLNEDWIKNKTEIFWYFLGLFTADGHLGKFNEVAIFQKDGHYLKQLQSLISHNGKLYGEDKTCYIIHITSKLLHLTLESYGFTGDKRYNAPFIKADSLKNQLLYLRGLFDGDGSLYYRYVSGRFEGINFQITTGSLEIMENVYLFLIKDLGINAYKDSAVSNVGNTFYHVGIRNKESIKKLFPLLYKDSKSICLYRKYKNFLKLLELIKLNDKVDDIVESSMKIGV